MYLRQIPNIERKLYTLLYYSIKCVIVYFQSLQIQLLSIFYLFANQFKNLLIFIRTKTRSYQSISNVSEVLHVPQNVCIIIDEEMSSEELFDLCSLISEVFCSVPIKSLTFYKFDLTVCLLIFINLKLEILDFK